MRLLDQYRASHTLSGLSEACTEMPRARSDFEWLGRIIKDLPMNFHAWRWSTCPCYFHDHTYGKSKSCKFMASLYELIYFPKFPPFWSEKILYYGGHKHPYQRLEHWQWVPHHQDNEGKDCDAILGSCLGSACDVDCECFQKKIYVAK